MIPPELIHHVEGVIRETLANWPPEWTGFHWPGYTLQHTQRVRPLARRFADEEGADGDELDLAALMHDIAKAEGMEHACRGAERARTLLDGGLPPEQVERIAQTISAHNCAVPGDPAEWRVLSDADKVDANFGMVAVARYFTIRGSRGHSLDEALAGVPAWEEHHLGILERLTLASGRRCADRRLVVMHRFCRELASDRVSRAVAQFFLDDCASPDLVRQTNVLATRDIEAAIADETRPFAMRLRREMNGEL